MVDMPTSANSFGRRVRNASKKARVVSWEEPSPKRTKPDKPSDIPAPLKVKGPLEQSSEENVASFVAKSFYGLVKSQPITADKNKSCFEKLSDISESVKKNLPVNYKTLLSHLDELMLEKAVLSPVKQAVLQTCSLTEFRKMYKDEYKELEEEMKMQNCIMTRQMSLTVRKKKEERSLNSDSSDDDDVAVKISDQDQKSNSGNQVSPQLVADLVTVSYHKDMSLSKNCTTPPRRILHKSNLRNNLIGVDGATCLSKSTTHAENQNHDVVINRNVEESVELNTNYKENPQVSNPSQDSSQKLSTPPSAERRFFKSRPSVDRSKRTGVLDKRFNLKFSHTALQVKDGKKKNKGLQKRQPESFSPKQTSVAVAANLSSEKSVQKQPESSISGFIFAPGFLSPDKRGSDNTGEDENLDLNQSNCFTYGSALPKQTVAHDSSGRKLTTDPTSGSLSNNTNIQTENCPANNKARKDVSGDDESSSKQDTSPDTSHAEENSLTSPQHKLFPIFGQKSVRFARSKKQSNGASPSSCSSKLPKDSNNSQMIIDAGQKKIGATHCQVCGMVYCSAHPADETQHAKFHKHLVEVLKFPGWKKERVVQEYPEDLSRVILVLSDDAKYAKKKVEEVNQLMGRELGFPDTAAARLHPYHKVFFYVEDKQITGCCVAESVQEGYRIIPGDLDNSQESGQRPWCCAQVPEPVCVGISRLWVAAEKRRRGVSTKLVDCVRQWYNYGSLIPKHKIAFSDPTPDGRRFAQKYMGTPTFLVYKFNYG